MSESQDGENAAAPGAQGPVLSVRVAEARKPSEGEILAINQALEARVAQRTDQLNRAHLDLEVFSSAVAHDLRAPLRAIDGFAQLLKADLGPQLNAEAQRDLEAIRRSARHMSDLINGLLDFSRIGQLTLAQHRVDMHGLAAAVIAEAAAAPQVRIDLGPLPEVEGDSAMLRQVWAHLIGNAIKFSGKRETPRVSIEGALADGEACFAVTDNGAGLDMQYADKLFGVFQRLHSSEEFDGTGIGLAMVKRIVERHGGRIWVASSAGAGATFRFTLPLIAITECSAAASQPAKHHQAE